jgi:hypothetical protein
VEWSACCQWLSGWGRYNIRGWGGGSEERVVSPPAGVWERSKLAYLMYCIMHFNMQHHRWMLDSR